MEISLGADVLKALAENVLDYQKELDDKKADKKVDEKRAEKNINAKDKQVATTLTSNEKTRYQKVGEELFKVTLEKLDAIIRKEKKAQRMSLDIPKESKSFSKKLKKERNVNIEKEKESSGFWKKLIAVAAGLGLVWVMFKDEIKGFFAKAGNWLSEIGDFLKPSLDELTEVFKSVGKMLLPIGETLMKSVTDLFAPLGKYFDTSNPDNIFANVGGFITDTCKGIFNGLGNIWDGAVDGIKWIGNALWDALKSLGSTIGGVVLDAFKTIGNVLGDIGTFLKDKIVSAVSGLFGGSNDAEVKQALGVAKTEAKTATEVVQAALNQDVIKHGNLDEMVSSAESFKEARIKALNRQLGSVEDIKKGLTDHLGRGIDIKGDEKEGFTVSINSAGQKILREKAAEDFGKNLFERILAVTSSNKGDDAEQQTIIRYLQTELKNASSQFIKITDDNQMEIDTGHESVKKAVENTYKKFKKGFFRDTNDVLNNFNEALAGTNKDALNEIMKAANDSKAHFQANVRNRIDALNAHAQADKQDKTNRWKLIESQGLGPFVRHEESIKTIKEVTDTLNKSLDALHKTIGESFVSVVNEKMLSNVKVDVDPVDGRTADVVINQVNLPQLNATYDNLKVLEGKKGELLEAQNKVLNDILIAIQSNENMPTINNIAVVNGSASVESTPAPSPNKTKAIPRPMD